MQQKDLHKLGKTDLLTLIYKQEKQIQQLTKEVEDLKQQLENRTIQMKEAGSIAEASLKINKIFEVAQQAADEYLKSIKEVNKPSHEYAPIDKNIAKDEPINEKKDKILNRNTYEKNIKYRIKRYKKRTNDKISKELVLVNNKMMEIKPKFLKRVVILLMFMLKKLSAVMKRNEKKINLFIKMVKLNNKIIFIKIKHEIIKIIECIKSIYDKIEQHMNDFGDYCELHFPSTMSTISYKIYVKKKNLKIILSRLRRKCKKRIKFYNKQISRFTKFIYTKMCKQIAKLCEFNKKIYKEAILHFKALYKYCNVKFTILKFKIRNAKSYKKKLLGQASDAIIPNKDNTLMILKKRTILYYKMLRHLKMYLQKLKYFTNMTSIIVWKYTKKECKNIINKINNQLEKFYVYCKKQITVLKTKILNKIHHVKQINEINEKMYPISNFQKSQKEKSVPGPKFSKKTKRKKRTRSQIFKKDKKKKKYLGSKFHF